MHHVKRSAEMEKQTAPLLGRLTESLCVLRKYDTQETLRLYYSKTVVNRQWELLCKGFTYGTFGCL